MRRLVRRVPRELSPFPVNQLVFNFHVSPGRRRFPGARARVRAYVYPVCIRARTHTHAHRWSAESIPGPPRERRHIRRICASLCSLFSRPFPFDTAPPPSLLRSPSRPFPVPRLFGCAILNRIVARNLTRERERDCQTESLWSLRIEKDREREEKAAAGNANRASFDP